MKIPKLFAPKKKLRASTARRSLVGADEMDYEEMSEPNMKLSRALLIVLVLHVVAVAGIIAFNAIKGRQGAFPAAPASSIAKADAAKTDATPEQALANKTSPTAAKTSVKDPEPTPARALPVTPEGANVYVVAKGDNPVKIAKKLKVSESELLALNHIDDPRKLQIGQKLLVPPKKTTAKKGN
ncbi:MAG: LysM peptidoglycan-binding domain-containing protein [Verrucomicrobiota bacterium]|nr:LysM peptidoglycan-binding domain-containing protein [Verrucomicrobiota bacterium]